MSLLCLCVHTCLDPIFAYNRLVWYHCLLPSAYMIWFGRKWLCYFDVLIIVCRGLGWLVYYFKADCKLWLLRILLEDCNALNLYTSAEHCKKNCNLVEILICFINGVFLYFICWDRLHWLQNYCNCVLMQLDDCWVMYNTMSLWWSILNRIWRIKSLRWILTYKSSPVTGKVWYLKISYFTRYVCSPLFPEISANGNHNCNPSLIKPFPWFLSVQDGSLSKKKK